MAEVLRTGIEARDLEVVIERPDGSRITVLVNIVPLRNGDGELIGAMNCFQDITDRKRAEEALRRSERLLRLVLDALPVGVAVVDRSGDIILSNPAVAAHLERVDTLRTRAVRRKQGLVARHRKETRAGRVGIGACLRQRRNLRQ